MGRACQQAVFPLGYVGGEAERLGPPTADKEGLSSGGRALLRVSLLTEAGFLSVFFFLFIGELSGPSLGFSLSAKAQYCC